VRPLFIALVLAVAQRYPVAVSALVIIIWDICLTTGDEVGDIFSFFLDREIKIYVGRLKPFGREYHYSPWPRFKVAGRKPWSLLKAAYFFVRYFPTIYQMQVKHFLLS
jgi:hypothetical protein